MINPSLFRHISRNLAEVFAEDVIVNDFTSVGGGDINSTFKLSSNYGDVFLKTNDTKRLPGLFESEEHGLLLLKQENSFRVPTPLKVGVYNDRSYLLMEFIDLERNGDWSAFGEALANLHKLTSTNFGLERANFIGSIVQQNSFKESWAEFYRELRLFPLMKEIIDQGLLSMSESKQLDALAKELTSIYPKEKPALLHGDLWSGNAAFSNGKPCIYDPAVYYGHREMDIAMTYLFGGFPAEMLGSYHSHFPLETGWQQRLEISQLYPLMVHTLLFGAGYAQQVKQILKQF